MEYKTNLQVSASELYYALINSILSEASAAVGKEVTYKMIKSGFKYKCRKVVKNKNVEITTHIKAPIENSKIELKMEYPPDNTYHMIYNIRSISKDETEVFYSETDKYVVKNIFQKHSFKRDMQKKFSKIEQYIILHRS